MLYVLFILAVKSSTADKIYKADLLLADFRVRRMLLTQPWVFLKIPLILNL